MLIQFGAPGPPPDGLDFGHLHQDPLGNQADPIGFGERDARIEQHVDGERALVEGRQEGARKQRRGDPRHRHGEQRHGDQRALMAKGAFEQRRVAALEQAHQGAVAMIEAFQMRQHVVGHHRRQRDRDREAGEDRDDVGLAQRREQPALDSRQREQRHEHQHDDRRRIDDAGPDLLRGRYDHVECRPGMFQRAIFAQAPEDVLHIDHGVVDQFAERDGDTAQRHGVDGQPGEVEDRGGGQDRDRDRGQRNHRGSPVQQEMRTARRRRRRRLPSAPVRRSGSRSR